MLQRLLVVIAVLLPLPALAEEAEAAPAVAASEKAVQPNFKPDMKGLSFGLPAGGGPTAGVTHFLDRQTALRLDVGLNLPVQPDFGLNLSVEAGYRMYLPRLVKGGRLIPFVQPGVFLRSAAGSDFFDVDKLTIALAGGLGIEFFLLENFSLSGQTGLALSFANGFDDIALTTGTSALFANFYW